MTSGLLLWLPVVLIFALLLSYLNQVSYFLNIQFIAAPMMVLLALLLPTWYMAKVSIPGETTMVLILARHIITAAVLVAFWLQLVVLFARLFYWINPQPNWPDLIEETLSFWMVTGFGLYSVTALVYYLIAGIQKNSQAQKQIAEQQLALSQAELQSLRTTVHPHFLFNSLTAMKSLISVDSEKAQEACGQLARFLRYSLRFSQETWVPFRDELGHIHDYLGIEKIRLGARLKWTEEIDEQVMDYQISSFLLLPVIENAIKHGIQQMPEGGQIQILVHLDGELIHIEVINPLATRVEEVSGEGYGLHYLGKRLEKSYDGAARLYTVKDAKFYKVFITIPAINPDEQSK